MVDTTVYIGEFAIHEPVTAITDYIIAILSFAFYIKLKEVNPTIQNWKLFFLFFAFSTLFGGTSHAFFEIKEGVVFKSIWLTGHALSVLSTFYAQQATLVSVLRDSSRKKHWRTSYRFQLFLFTSAIIIFQSFTVVIVNTALGLIPVMILHFKDAKKVKSSVWIAYGISISFLTAFINGFKISIHEYFNYKDISHVLIMVSLYVMYTGVKEKATS